MTDLEQGEKSLRSRPISLSSRSLSWAVVKPHQAEEAYSMDARVVDRATSNNCGDPSPWTKDPHRGNPDSTLEDGGWVNRGAKAASVDNVCVCVWSVSEREG